MSALRTWEFPQIEQPIRCPKCTAKGLMVWEQDGAEKVLVRLSANFYERLTKVPPFAIELVCRQCGMAQLE
jgi:DNA-directed RNA polymerase subunit RPC12/RpoP